ncbi:MAG: cbb3-type cytochrome oxidase assembly protein CcoS [Mariprofundaceae bacterium]|nr:cbb3-type cytochrome oxidase assembly protein CcoS [Mariprofundaceae bacterium]
MSVIYGLIPGMILLGLVSVLVFFWAVRSGQYDDMEGPAHRILDDDDLGENKLNVNKLNVNKPDADDDPKA